MCKTESFYVGTTISLGISVGHPALNSRGSIADAQQKFRQLESNVDGLSKYPRGKEPQRQRVSETMNVLQNSFRIFPRMAIDARTGGRTVSRTEQKNPIRKFCMSY